MFVCETRIKENLAFILSNVSRIVTKKKTKKKLNRDFFFLWKASIFFTSWFSRWVAVCQWIESRSTKDSLFEFRLEASTKRKKKKKKKSLYIHSITKLFLRKGSLTKKKKKISLMKARACFRCENISFNVKFMDILHNNWQIRVNEPGLKLLCTIWSSISLKTKYS